MAYTKQHLIESYVAESLREGTFLSTVQVNDRAELPSWGAYKATFDGIKGLQYACMIELAVWTAKDKEIFIEENGLEVKWDKDIFHRDRVV